MMESERPQLRCEYDNGMTLPYFACVYGLFLGLFPTVQKRSARVQAVRKSEKSYSFMCGDGGNDVGALKEAINISTCAVLGEEL